MSKLPMSLAAVAVLLPALSLAVPATPSPPVEGSDVAAARTQGDAIDAAQAKLAFAVITSPP
jgi:hypothetical protein